jgi:hypothetical protein
MKNWFLTGLLLLALSTGLKGQDGLLQRSVTLQSENQPIAQVLDLLAQQGKFSLSYGEGVFDPNRKVSVSFKAVPLRTALDQLFKGSVSYEVVGNHLILKKSAATLPNPGQRVFRVQGEVKDLQSGRGLRDVSIYPGSRMQAGILSDANGKYQLKISQSAAHLELRFRRQGYRDTSIRINHKPEGNVCMVGMLQIPSPASLPVIPPDTVRLPDTAVALPDSAPVLAFPPDSLKPADSSNRLLAGLRQLGERLEKSVIAGSQQLHELNVRDSQTRVAQISFFPPFGSNGAMSGRINNVVSLNILAGHNGGVRGFEAGGLLNSLSGSMQGAQVAGLSNFVNGPVMGFQAAGLSNFNCAGMRGAQMAGLLNFNRETVENIQAAGVANINTGRFRGFQMAGVANINTRESDAMQLAGVWNQARRIHGLQASGVVNIADTVHGLQIGLINIARQNTGGAIGLINIIGNGYHQLELANSDLFLASIAWRSGTRRLFTTLGAGYTGHKNGFPAWGYSAGIGTAFGSARRIHLTSELTAHQLMYRRHSMWLNTAAALDLMLNIRLFPGMHITAGPSLNALGTDIRRTAWTDFWGPQLDNRIFYDYTENDYRFALWSGWKFSVRFF